MHRYSWLAFLLVIAVSVTTVAQDVAHAALDDARVREVITLAEGGLSLDVIMAKIIDIGSFPELDAADLVALKQIGVPDRALVTMIELEDAAFAPATVPPAAATTPQAQPDEASATDEDAAGGADTATLRLVVQRPFWITFFEVAVDQEIVSSTGRLWKGRSERAQQLRRPPRVKGGKTFTALEMELEPGSHEIAFGYAVTLVEDDAQQTDDWGEFAHEYYVNRGVRARPGDRDAHPGEWGASASVTCQVAAGKTCVVTATLDRSYPTRLGGIPTYGVGYTTELE